MTHIILLIPLTPTSCLSFRCSSAAPHALPSWKNFCFLLMTLAIPSQDPFLLVTPQTYLCSEPLREGEPEVPSGEVIRTKEDTKKTMAAQETRL